MRLWFLALLLTLPALANAKRVSYVKLAAGFDRDPSRFWQLGARVGIDDYWQLRASGTASHDSDGQDLTSGTLGVNYRFNSGSYLQGYISSEQLSSLTRRLSVEPAGRFVVNDTFILLARTRISDIRNRVTSASQQELVLGVDINIAKSLTLYVDYGFSSFQDPNFLAETLGLIDRSLLLGLFAELNDDLSLFLEYSTSHSLNSLSSHMWIAGFDYDVSRNWFLGANFTDIPGFSVRAGRYW